MRGHPLVSRAWRSRDGVRELVWRGFSDFCLGFHFDRGDEGRSWTLLLGPVAAHWRGTRPGDFLEVSLSALLQGEESPGLASASAGWKWNTDEHTLWSASWPWWRYTRWTTIRWESYETEPVDVWERVPVWLPEGVRYVNVEMAAWARGWSWLPRFTWQRGYSARVTPETPTPIPGKGTMPYNCGPDAIYSLSCGVDTPGRTGLTQAIGQFVSSVLRDRRGDWLYGEEE
jgi:hypothetical protein